MASEEPAGKPATRKDFLERLRQPQASHFSKMLGIEVTSREPGRCEASLAVKEEHTNLGGVAHGGLAASLLDTVMGAAVVSTLGEDEWCATLQLSVSYLAGVTPGPVRAEGVVTRRAKRAAFAEGRAFDAEGKLLATAQGTWHVWPSGE
ncbi:MAG TPA: PaaI family thioesterase [Candidatus Thermoplasmatota archaeon]|nr:PaaI family thioesterase [Candidatus Thermoplasmatota archaeon]